MYFRWRLLWNYHSHQRLEAVVLHKKSPKFLSLWLCPAQNSLFIQTVNLNKCDAPTSSRNGWGLRALWFYPRSSSAGSSETLCNMMSIARATEDARYPTKPEVNAMAKRLVEYYPMVKDWVSIFLSPLLIVVLFV